MSGKDSIEFIYCAHGCGFTTWKYDSRGRERHFIKGHAWLGKKHSSESKTKIGNVSKGRIRSEESIKKQFESRKGYRHSEETKEKIAKSHIGKTVGEDNGFWVGDKVGYEGVHQWVRRHFPPPKFCHMCKEKPPPFDLANIAGIYNREFKNWAYFCRKCHSLFDNIYNRNFKSYNDKRKKSQ